MSDAWPQRPASASRSVERGHDAASLAASPPTSGHGYTASHQSRLLDETQAVVMELKDDLLRMQEENAELRQSSTNRDAQEKLRELQIAFDSAVERHKKDLKEARFKNLRLQQERQKLKQTLSELEVELATRPPPAAPREDVAEKADLLEAAVDELRRENAALREEKLQFMTCELKRLHPRDERVDVETEVERLQSGLDAAVSDLTCSRQKIKELQDLNNSQENLLERRAAEYEALLESRRAEIETMQILSTSLDETQALYDASQKEIAKLQEENRELVSEAMITAARRENEGRRESIPSTTLEQEGSDKSADELREELAMVKRTASGAISTLSTSLKKSLLHSQELCTEFEKDRKDMKEEYDKMRSLCEEAGRAREAAEARAKEAEGMLVVKEEDLQSFKRQMDEQKQRTKEAKQRLKAEILDTKQLIKNQQREVLRSEDDDEFLALLNIPNRAREILASPPPQADGASSPFST
eukprot:TRINITY_DN15835_c0_g1_i2.p1 TRINITY_DN15835_c0_g1~~TRINITY_DN15835_c0_g1_i2.p1  ORF type:complete len:475 (+),score=217.23 TRINITY_DN15835_c0_g1_i2:45-1469(+)